MVRFNFLAACTALVFGPSVFAAPTAEEHKNPAPTGFHTLMGFDPDFDPSEDNQRVSKIIPEVVTLRVSGQGGNFTDFPPSVTGPAEPVRRDILGGVDDRALWSNRDYPYRAMGRIQLSNGVFCSASLIGSRHVITARHCVVNQDASIRFQPAYYQGEVLGGYDVIAVFHIVPDQDDWCSYEVDWAILVLSEKAGEANGWLGLTTVNPNTQLGRPLFVQYGYPGDKGGSLPYRQDRITAVASRYCNGIYPLETDADAAGGQSGSPFWVNENDGPYVHGLVVAGNSEVTLVSGGSTLMEGYSILLKDYPI